VEESCLLQLIKPTPVAFNKNSKNMLWEKKEKKKHFKPISPRCKTPSVSMGMA